MIKGFEEETAPLTEYEQNTLLPIFISSLACKIGRDNSVTNKFILTRLKPRYKVTDSRVRKIINHIRTNDLVSGLIATSEGYYVAQSEDELIEYESSLKGRENAIRQVREAIARQRRVLYNASKVGQQINLFI